MNALESAFSAIARSCFPASERPGLMLMLNAYFDDSGTHGDSRAVVWGGFLGSAEQWGNFDKAWRAKLTRPLPGKAHLAKFGLADCRWGVDEFEPYSYPERDLVQAEFRQIIVDAGVIGLAYAVDCAVYDRLVQGPARDFLGDAETACFSACFGGAIEQAVRFFPGEMMLSLHFDLGRKSPKLDKIVDRVTKGYRDVPAIVNISFNPVSVLTPLQAADIIATENYWHASGTIAGNADPRPHFSHFLKRLKGANGYLAQEPEIRDTLKRYKL